MVAVGEHPLRVPVGGDAQLRQLLLGGQRDRGQHRQVDHRFDVGRALDGLIPGLGQQRQPETDDQAHHRAEGQVAGQRGVAAGLRRHRDLDEPGLADRRQLGPELEVGEVGHGGLGLAGQQVELVAQIVGQAVELPLQAGCDLRIGGPLDPLVEIVERGPQLLALLPQRLQPVLEVCGGGGDVSNGGVPLDLDVHGGPGVGDGRRLLRGSRPRR